MQLTSFLLPAVALLAQAASVEKYLLFSNHPEFDPVQYGPAKIASNQTEASVGFYKNPELPFAQIPLDEGDIGSAFFLETVGPGKWALLAKNGRDSSEYLFTNPFAIRNFTFVMTGEDSNWALCDDGKWNLYLFASSVGIEKGCKKTDLYSIPA